MHQEKVLKYIHPRWLINNITNKKVKRIKRGRNTRRNQWFIYALLSFLYNNMIKIITILIICLNSLILALTYDSIICYIMLALLNFITLVVLIKIVIYRYIISFFYMPFKLMYRLLALTFNIIMEIIKGFYRILDRNGDMLSKESQIKKYKW